MPKRFWSRKSGDPLLSAEHFMAAMAVVLLVILASLQLASIRAHNRDSERRLDLYNLQLAIQRFYALNGYYPTQLSALSGLPSGACNDPTAGGNCQNPAYDYTAYASGAQPSPYLSSNCDNHKTMCGAYILFSRHMETVANPYTLSSN